MAMVAADGYEVTFTLGGIDDSVQNRTYHSTAADEAAVVVDMAAMGAQLVLVSDGKQKSRSYKKVYIEDAYTRPTVATAERGDAAIITGEIQGSPLEKWNLSIPFPKASLFLAAEGENYNVIDITNANLGTFIGQFETGGNFTLSDGEIAGQIIKGKRV